MKNDISASIAKELVKKIEMYDTKVSAKRVGYVSSLGDGVVRVSGLPQVAYLEKVRFDSGVVGFAISLDEDSVGVIVLGEYLAIKEGDEVEATGELLSVPVGEEFLGRVINPLGEAIDGKGPIKSKKMYPVEKDRPECHVQAARFFTPPDRY